MATMVTEGYDAPIEAGASEDKARKAASVPADYDRDFYEVKSDLKVLKAMNGVAIAGVVAILLRLFVH